MSETVSERWLREHARFYEERGALAHGRDALRLLRECLDETAHAPVCPWCGEVRREPAYYRDGHHPDCWRLDAMALLADAAKE